MCDRALIISHGDRKIPVSCGYCVKCKKERVQEWVFRMHWERKRSKNAYFVTLTYDEEHVPWGDNKESLCKKDLQKFFKSLRYHEEKNGNKNKIRYYACGEYGETYGRPHYHAIIFNVSSWTNIEKAWDQGFSYYPELESNAGMAYTVKYTMKSWRAEKGREKEFSLKSKGLGMNYLTPETVRWHTKSIENCYVLYEGRKQKMPRVMKTKIYSAREIEEIGIYQTNRINEKLIKETAHLKNVKDIAAFHEIKKLRRENQKFEKMHGIF